MDDQKFSGLLSQLIPDEIENRIPPGKKDSSKQHNLMVELLKTLAGEAGGGIENEVSAFLNGKGALLETTRSAVARGGSTAAADVAAFLTNQLHLSAPLANLIAPLVVQIFPAIGKLAGTGATGKPKPRRKKREDSSAKPSQAHKPKKPKSASSTKPAASHKPKKPKTSSSSKPAKPRPSSVRPGGKRPKRALEIDTDQEA